MSILLLTQLLSSHVHPHPCTLITSSTGVLRFQVLYPQEAARITISIKSGRIPAPGAVLYSLESLTPVARPFLVGVGGIATGVIAWDPSKGASTELQVPVEWSQASPFFLFIAELFPLRHAMKIPGAGSGYPGRHCERTASAAVCRVQTKRAHLDTQVNCCFNRAVLSTEQIKQAF